MGTALSNIAVAGDNDDFACHHDVGSSFDAVCQAFAATVEIVKFGFRHRVVDVDGGNLQFATGVHLVQTVDARGGLLRKSVDPFE